jgi:hypothetical protein
MLGLAIFQQDQHPTFTNTGFPVQDRSYETGTPPIGIQGRQRGYKNQPDGYLFAQVMFSFNLSSYRCPSAK